MAAPGRPRIPWAWRCAGMLACAAIALAVYAPVTRGQFVWDDGVLIVRNTAQLDQWSDALRGFTEPVITSRPGAPYYRPILMASFLFDFQRAGLEPHAFHRTGLVLHVVDVALVWLVLATWVGGVVAPTAGALLFALHPIQAQAVALNLGRNETLLLLPVGIALLVYPAWRLATGWKRRSLTLVLLACYALALWTKETGIVLPAILLAAERFFFRESWANTWRRQRSLLAGSVVIALLYLGTRVRVLGAVSHDSPLSIVERLRVAIAVFGYYVQHTLLPIGLSATPYHARLVLPGSNDFTLAVLCCLAFAWALVRAIRRQSPLAFALLAFALAILPVIGL